jgi:hypothetical protein
MSRVPETEDSSGTRPAQTVDPQDAERTIPALKVADRLWHSFAAHLLESGYDMPTVQSFSAIKPVLSVSKERQDDDDLYPCPEPWPDWCAHSARPALREGRRIIMPIRIRRGDKNNAGRKEWPGNRL